MTTWALAWASVRLNESGMMILIIFTLPFDVAIFALLMDAF